MREQDPTGRGQHEPGAKLEERQGIEFDEQTGLRHATHLAWNALARLELMLREEEGRR